MKYKAYTDASIKDTKTIHSYYLINNYNEVILSNKVESDILNIQEAEKYSIELLLSDCFRKNIKDITIYTDSKCTVKKFYENPTLKDYLNSCQSELLWISRNKNKIADRMKYNNIRFMPKKRVKCTFNPTDITTFKKPSQLYKGNISSENVSNEEKEKLLKLYNNFVNDDTEIDTILNWISDKPSLNSKVGRRFVIRQYIEHFHPLCIK